ncbi:hypothetical protein AVEN_154534-1 [Araneus ventricosus]|uniref:Uncharacterized protein n=1 Tax=Araneus ventricosus TaxID=182803 RepID=A0A4Y2IX88_ARAVE|nr:hypothetical protein AVEN_154534-1 [Araneus ventricosus]
MNCFSMNTTYTVPTTSAKSHATPPNIAWDLLLPGEVEQLDVALTQQIVGSSLKKYSTMLPLQLSIIAKLLPLQRFVHELILYHVPYMFDGIRGKCPGCFSNQLRTILVR